MIYIVRFNDSFFETSDNTDLEALAKEIENEAKCRGYENYKVEVKNDNYQQS